MSATVRDVMTTHVVAVRKTATYKEMVARLREYRVSAFPVLDDDNTVIGVVSEADLLAKEAHLAGNGGFPAQLPGLLRSRRQAKAAGVTAGDLMTRPAVTIGPDEPVSRAARLMYSHKVKRLPVVDSGGHLVGIISRTDVLSVYSRPDEDLRREVTDVIAHAFLLDPTSFTVTVKDGVVTLEGRPETVKAGRLVIDEVRHMEGVVAVRDRFAYPPPESVPVSGPLF